MMFVRSAALPLILSTLGTLASAQELGIDVCACQPSVYEITLDNSLSCNDRDVMGPGILITECLVETRLNEEANVTDFVFQTISEVQLIELDGSGSVLASTPFRDGPYFNGDVIRYTSIIRTNPDMINNQNFPRGFQAIITATNRMHQPLVNTWGILYDNDCGIFPLLSVGQKIGWSVFVSASMSIHLFGSCLAVHLTTLQTDLGNPPLQFCPIAPPTMFPTAATVPTPAPTDAKQTAFPTSMPVAPVETVQPTFDPTNTPTVMPTHDGLAPVCPPITTRKTGGGAAGSGGGLGGGNGGNGGHEMKKKKTKKDYYYGRMQKTKKSKSNSSGGSGKSGKSGNSRGGKGRSGSHKSKSRRSLVSNDDQNDRDLKTGEGPKFTYAPVPPMPTFAPSMAPSDCPEP